MPYVAEDRTIAVEAGTEAPRQRRETLLPQIAARALAGQSCRQIAAACGVPKSTVNRWLQALREDCPTRFAGSAQLIADAVAGYKSLYHEALESWRLSQRDRETEVVVETQTARGPKKKRTVRRESRAGDVACLAAAHRALDGIAKVAARVAPRSGNVAVPDQGLIASEALPSADVHKISEDELRAIGAVCSAESRRREKAAETPQPQPVMKSSDREAESSSPESGPPEERALPEPRGAKPWLGGEALTKTNPQRSGVGHGATTRLCSELYPEEREPSFYAGFCDWHRLPVVNTRSTIRGRTPRQKAVESSNCPIPIAKTRAKTTPRKGRSFCQGRQPRRDVYVTAEGSG